MKLEKMGEFLIPAWQSMRRISSILDETPRIGLAAGGTAVKPARWFWGGGAAQQPGFGDDAKEARAPER